MNEKLLQYWNKYTQYWKQVNRKQKIIFLSGVALILLTLILVTYNFSKTEYVQAFTDLDPSDASAITEYLAAQDIEYKLSTDGRSIGVPATEAAKVKINVESQGLMKNGSLGYGIFKENLSGLGMTDNEFDVLSVDAKAGEVQQLINAMNGVENSKVLITMPEKSVFLNDEIEQSSASVVVKFKTGYKPDQQRIDTIYNLVAHSVPDLPMDNISISDQNNELLPSSKSTGGLGTTTDVVLQQFEIKKKFESDIQLNVHKLLGTILGPGKVVVSVVSSLNFDKKNSTQNLVTPVNTADQKGIEISLEKIQKSYSSDGSSTDGGVPGTGQTDIPGYPGGSDSGKTESEEISEKVNYDVNRITNEIVSSPYAVKDLTINVAVEPPKSDDPTSLSQETTDAIKQILVNIVAASLADSGQTLTDDQLAKKVSVLAHSFEGKPAEASNSIFKSPWFYGLGAVALAIIAVGALSIWRKRRKEALEEELPVAEQAVQVPTIDLENVSNENQVRKQLESLAKKKPEEFVNLLRTWLADE